MYTKFIVAGVIVLVFALAGKTLLVHRSTDIHPGGNNIKLVPKTLGGAEQLKHWHNDLHDSIVEVGALYAAGGFGPAPVLLDFRRNYPRTHNGIGCFLNQGETLDSENLQTLQTASGTAVFDVGILRTPGQVRLIAATECTSGKCVEEKLPFLNRFWKQWSLKNLLANQSGSVVPAAIILTRKTEAAGADAAITELQAELKKVAAVVDLAPARRLAAAQSGKTEKSKSDVAAKN